MGAAPLSWLAKVGGDTLKTKAKLLSSAINELYNDGQCNIVAVVDDAADNGKTVLITTDDNNTYSGTIVNKKCEFLLPPKTLYTVQKVSSGSAEFTTKVEAGYGDYILVHLNTGHVEVKQGDIVGLDYIKAATADNLKDKVPEANAVKELNSSLNRVPISLLFNSALNVTMASKNALFYKNGVYYIDVIIQTENSASKDTGIFSIVKEGNVININKRLDAILEGSSTNFFIFKAITSDTLVANATTIPAGVYKLKMTIEE